MTEYNSDSASDLEVEPSASSATESTEGTADSTANQGRVYDIAYHLAWVRKDSPTELPKPLVEDLRAVLHETADRKDTAVCDMTVKPSYIHLVVEPPPHYSPHHIATWFKNVSAKRFEQSHPENETSITWADDHFMSTAGENGRVAVRRYLEAHLTDNTE